VIIWTLIKKWLNKLFCKSNKKYKVVQDKEPVVLPAVPVIGNKKEEEDMLRNSVAGTGGSGRRGPFSLYNYRYKPAKSKTNVSSLGIPDFYASANSAGLFVKPDGTKCWMADPYFPQYELTLSTPWDFSTITKTYSRVGNPWDGRNESDNYDKDLWKGEGVGTSPVFDSTGTRCFIQEEGRARRLNQYSCPTPWSINGMVKRIGLTPVAVMFQIAGQVNGFAINPNGRAWYSLIQYTSGLVKVVKVTIAIPFQVDSCVWPIVPEQGYSQVNVGVGVRQVTGWWLSPDALTFVVTWTGAMMSHYRMATPYDFGNAVLIENWNVPSTSASTDIMGVGFSDDDDLRKMVILTANSSNSSENGLHLYQN
jgi:hypothetical protein